MCWLCLGLFFFFFKQKTAYERRISDWSSDVCSSDLSGAFERVLTGVLVAAFALCAVATGLVYGARVLAQLQAMVGVQGLQWMALLAGCLGLSWSLDRLRRRAGHDGVARPA